MKTPIATQDNAFTHFSLASLFDHHPVGVAVIRRDGTLRYANPMACEIFEIRQEQFSEKFFSNPLWVALDEKGNETIQSEWPAVLTFQSKKVQVDSIHGWSVGGKIKWLSIDTTPIFEQDRTVDNVLAYFKDITEERAKQMQSRQSEADLRTILNLSENGYIVLSSKNEILSFNKRAAKLLHLISDMELKEGRDLYSILSPSYRTQANSDLQHAIEGHFLSREYAVKTSKGKDKWMVINYLPQPDKSQEQVIVEVKNVTKDKELENKLDDANEELIHLMNNSLKSFFIVDDEFRIIQYNKHAENETKLYFNKKPKKNESILPYIAETYQSKFKENVKMAIEGKRTKEEEERAVGPGLSFFFEVEFFPSMNKRSKKHNVGFSSTNITEKKMTRQMLLKSVSEMNKYKGALYESCHVVLVDVSGKILDVNELFCKQLGFERSNLVGQSLLLALDKNEETLPILLAHASKLGKMMEILLTYKSKNGKFYSKETNILPVLDETGKVTEFLFSSKVKHK